MYKYDPHNSPVCYVLCVGVRDTCIPVGGIVEAGDLIGALHEDLLELLSVVPPTHLLYQFTAVIYIIQTTGECLWALNHLLAFIS